MKNLNVFDHGTILWLGASLAFIPACSRSEPSSVIIEHRAIARVNGCHVSIDSVNFNPKYPKPFVSFRSVCNVPESALKEKNWWGNQPEPLMNSLQLGGCIRLAKIFYCATKMEPGKYVKLDATFEDVLSDGTLLEPIEGK